MAGHALAQPQRHTVGMVDVEAERATPDDLGQQQLDVRLGGGERLLDLYLERCHGFSSDKTHKKSGRAPTSGTSTGQCPGAKSCSFSVAPGRPPGHLALYLLTLAFGRGSPRTSAVPIHAVI